MRDEVTQRLKNFITLNAYIRNEEKIYVSDLYIPIHIYFNKIFND